jgi:hypothetical protein
MECHDILAGRLFKSCLAPVWSDFQKGGAAAFARVEIHVETAVSIIQAERRKKHGLLHRPVLIDEKPPNRLARPGFL